MVASNGELTSSTSPKRWKYVRSFSARQQACNRRVDVIMLLWELHASCLSSTMAMSTAHLSPSVVSHDRPPRNSLVADLQIRGAEILMKGCLVHHAMIDISVLISMRAMHLHWPQSDATALAWILKKMARLLPPCLPARPSSALMSADPAEAVSVREVNCLDGEEGCTWPDGSRDVGTRGEATFSLLMKIDDRRNHGLHNSTCPGIQVARLRMNRRECRQESFSALVTT